jgi:VanZ family protein
MVPLITTITALRVASWGLVATIVILSTIPAAVRPTTGAHYPEHVAIYLVTGLVFGLWYSSRWMAAIKLAVFAAGIEVLQYFIPGRHARLADLMLDVLGTCAGVLLASAFDWVKRITA